MHVPTHSFGEVDPNIEEIQKRVIDSLFHVRDSDGSSAFVVSIFLPESQCHVLVALNEENPAECALTVVGQTVNESSIKKQCSADEYEQAVSYVKHILLEFDRRRTVSNVVITTDGLRVKDVSGLVHQLGSDKDSRNR